MRFQQALGTFETFGLARDEADLPTALCKALGDSETYSGAGAGDNDRLH